MENSLRFLSAFNRIEKQLNVIMKNKDYVPFSKMVRILSKSNVIVRRYHDDLLEFADLRNAIVHERTDPDFVIAEPHDRTVESIENIEKELTEPKKVIPMFKKKVYSFQLESSLSQILTMIKESVYSQFPVYENERFIGLITENGIANWLAQNVEEDIFSIQETQIKDLIQYEEVANNYAFISEQSSIYEVIEIFKDWHQNGHKLDAILITKNGMEDESLLGIITIADIVEIKLI